MDEKNLLAERFEASRPHLRGVAYRMLGSLSEADDAVQDAWLRVASADTGEVDNLRGWLTTVVARLCLDRLRARRSRREESIGEDGLDDVVDADEAIDPEQAVAAADSVGLALLVVLETLSPAERVAFVLHDLFDLPFDQIAPIVGRSPEAARQLASRARRRVRGAPASAPDKARQRQVVEAFLAASKGGDFEALMTLLDPDVVFRSDPVAVRMGNQPELLGARAVAEAFKGRAQAAKPAFADGAPALAVVLGGELRVVVRLTVVDGRVTELDAVADPDRIARMQMEVLD